MDGSAKACANMPVNGLLGGVIYAPGVLFIAARHYGLPASCGQARV
jgi:hypothetical protein